MVGEAASGTGFERSPARRLLTVPRLMEQRTAGLVYAHTARGKGSERPWYYFPLWACLATVQPTYYPPPDSMYFIMLS